MKEFLQQALTALENAKDAVECWSGYASEYFQKKHDLDGDIAGIDADMEKLRVAIDSLTQDAQPCAASHVCDCQEAEMPCARAELTDAEIEEELEKVHARFSMYSADVKNIHAARAVIAADRAKRSKQ